MILSRPLIHQNNDNKDKTIQKNINNHLSTLQIKRERMENKLDINHNEKSSLDSIKLQTKSMVLQNNANKNKKVDGLIRPKITEISNLKFVNTFE